MNKDERIVCRLHFLISPLNRWHVIQGDLFCGVTKVKTNLIRPMAVPTPMAVQVETSTASNPRWETHLSVRNSPRNCGWGEGIRTYLTMRMTLTKPKR